MCTCERKGECCLPLHTYQPGMHGHKPKLPKRSQRFIGLIFSLLINSSFTSALIDHALIHKENGNYEPLYETRPSLKSQKLNPFQMKPISSRSEYQQAKALVCLPKSTSHEAPVFSRSYLCLTWDTTIPKI